MIQRSNTSVFFANLKEETGGQSSQRGQYPQYLKTQAPCQMLMGSGSQHASMRAPCLVFLVNTNWEKTQDYNKASELLKKRVLFCFTSWASKYTRKRVTLLSLATFTDTQTLKHLLVVGGLRPTDEELLQYAIGTKMIPDGHWGHCSNPKKPLLLFFLF